MYYKPRVLWHFGRQSIYECVSYQNHIHTTFSYNYFVVVCRPPTIPPPRHSLSGVHALNEQQQQRLRSTAILRIYVERTCIVRMLRRPLSVLALCGPPRTYTNKQHIYTHKHTRMPTATFAHACTYLSISTLALICVLFIECFHVVWAKQKINFLDYKYRRFSQTICGNKPQQKKLYTKYILSPYLRYLHIITLR